MKRSRAGVPGRRGRSAVVGAVLVAVALTACTSDSGDSVSAPATLPAGGIAPQAGPEAATPSPGAVAPAPTVPAAAAPPTVPVAQVVTLNEIETPPGVANDGFVGAASDVATETCARVGDVWEASGTVTNASGADANYRIYVSFNRAGSTDSRALIQTNVSVPDTTSKPWKATAAVTDDGLTCTLRVERVKA